MRVYEATVKVVTPLTVAAGTGYKGYIYTAKNDYIPGSVFRGAMLTQMVKEGVIDLDTANSLALSPDYAVTPLIVSKEEGNSLLRDLYIAHELCWITKWPIGGEKRVFSAGAERLAEIAGAGFEEKLAEYLCKFTESLSKKRDVQYAPGEVKSAAGMPVALVKVDNSSMWVQCSAETSCYTQVAIDHARRAAAPEMLYAYEYVKPGTVYKGYMAVGEGSPLLELAKRGEFYISVGRGVSRGYGACRVTLKPLEVPEPSGKRGDVLVFEALSPVFTLSPLPRPPKPGDVLEVNSGWYRGMYGKPLAGKLEVLHVLGSTMVYRGWSLRTSNPKLPVKALRPGSLLVCRYRGDAEVLKLLPLLGLDPYASAGFNQLIPLLTDPLRGGSS